MRSLVRRWRFASGGALVELAVSLPVLVVVFVATVDFARVFYTAISLTSAARAGAQYGAQTPANSGDSPGMESTARSATSLTGVTAVASRLCQCVTDTGGAFFPTTPPNTCHDNLQCQVNSAHMIVTVTVTTSKTFTTIMSGVPGIPGTVSLTRTATMRVVQ